ncbi:MAG: hypothetical protein WCJ93_08275 [Methanomicrobiales archaeon]
MRKPGALLENVGRENGIAFPRYNTGLVVILPEKEGREYWKELDGRITTKPGWHVEAETGKAMNTSTMRIATGIAPALQLSNFNAFIFINFHLDYISYVYGE